MAETRILIAIATYRRPDDLHRLLTSLEPAVKFVKSARIEVIVVDNDPAGGAEETCLAHLGIRARYLLQPIPGISATRNVAVAAADGIDFIVFIDDDEVVAPHWLAELLNVQACTNADLVAGPVYSVLPETTSQIVNNSGLFDRPGRPNLSILTEAGTGNLLCKYSLFADLDPSQWFQAAFSLTGGEDAELTRRFHREGAKIVWASEATVWENIPAARANLRWLANRYRRVGAVDFHLDTGHTFRRSRGLISGCARVLVGAPRLAWVWVTRRKIDGGAFRRLFRGIGFIEAATGAGHAEYGRQGLA